MGNDQRGVQSLPPGFDPADRELCGRADKALDPGAPIHYAVAFTVRAVHRHRSGRRRLRTLLGRMLGEVPAYWTMLVGAVLIWVAVDMLGLTRCSMSGSLLARIKIKGLLGAFILGLAYGILSGSCTFGFIAPILAIITIQQKIFVGILFIVLFRIGHCVPIAVAGSSTAKVKRLLESSSFHEGGLWFRKCAGVAIGLLKYFILRPFFGDT